MGEGAKETADDGNLTSCMLSRPYYRILAGCREKSLAAGASFGGVQLM
jgi:hypothetical protein